MKLMNFRRFDPDYEGTGLQRGNKDEEVVWDLFASNPDKMNEVAASIRSFVSSDTYIPPKEVISDDEEEGEEGTAVVVVVVVVVVSYDSCSY